VTSEGRDEVRLWHAASGPAYLDYAQWVIEEIKPKV
jgi:hypothetical protein